MIPSPAAVHAVVAAFLDTVERDGRDVDDLRAALPAAAGDLYRLAELAQRAEDAVPRPGWPYDEPGDIAAIEAACEADDWDIALGEVDGVEACLRIEAAFLGRVAGCMLGKPLEVMLSGADLRTCLESAGSWPLTDYVTEAALAYLPFRQRQWLNSFVSASPTSHPTTTSTTRCSPCSS